jgi:hypothetical protein
MFMGMERTEHYFMAGLLFHWSSMHSCSTLLEKALSCKVAKIRSCRKKGRRLLAQMNGATRFVARGTLDGPHRFWRSYHAITKARYQLGIVASL